MTLLDGKPLTAEECKPVYPERCLKCTVCKMLLPKSEFDEIETKHALMGERRQTVAYMPAPDYPICEDCKDSLQICAGCGQLHPPETCEQDSRGGYWCSDCGAPEEATSD